MGRTVDRILNNINLMEYMKKCGYTPVPVGSCYTLKEHDSVRIFPESNTYFHSSRSNKRLNVINFVEWHYNISNFDAIKKLAVDLNDKSLYTVNQANGSFNQKQKENTKKNEPLVLPEKTQGQFKHVFAYLNKTRGIDSAIIQDIISRDMLYEDTKRNATFINYTDNGEPCFCYQRGTSNNPEYTFKRIITGSDFSKAWCFNNGASKLFITEAIIDDLSIMTLLKKNGKNYKDYDYLATCGTSMKSIVNNINENPKIKTVYLSFDNDSAGNNYRNKARIELYKNGFNGKIIDKAPVNKDFNLDLQRLKLNKNDRNIENYKTNWRIQK